MILPSGISFSYPPPRGWFDATLMLRGFWNKRVASVSYAKHWICFVYDVCATLLFHRCDRVYPRTFHTTARSLQQVCHLNHLLQLEDPPAPIRSTVCLDYERVDLHVAANSGVCICESISYE